MSLIRIPGLIDTHVHLRDPGSTDKEDFFTGSRAAVRGGFTFLLDMPNNPGCPTVTPERLEEKIRLSSQSAVCSVGFHYGTDGVNTGSFQSAINNPSVFGLKIYAGETTGEILVDDPDTLDLIFRSWESAKPILLHAEGGLLQVCLDLAKEYERSVHVCHIATIRDLEEVKKRKSRRESVTCGVTPHHLYLTASDVAKLGVFGDVKPAIGDEETRDVLWDGLINGTIDLVESDHAPHTRQDKLRGAHSSGVPGLETTLGLFCRSVFENRITLEQVVRWLHDEPMRIFNIPDQKNTFVELDPSKPFIVGKDGYETKCAWSPFDGWELFGPVRTVVVKNRPLVLDGIFV
jgi:dihydroorotase (multifunctional complex type)